MWRSSSITRILSPGQYELHFEFVTETAKIKAESSQELFKITIMMTERAFYTDKYIKYQKDAIKDCALSTNLPLALSKSNTLKEYEDEQVYDYPIMRLSGRVLLNDFVLDTFNFRINETSRFYMNIGSHMMASHPILRLNELRDYGVAYLGMQ